MLRWLIALALLLLGTVLEGAGPALADVVGRAAVPDGDVLSINRQRFRIWGIDAVEVHQFCYVDGKPWACGPVAVRALEVLVALEPVTCRETADPPDPAGAWAVCTVGGKDIGDTLVRAGMALALRAQADKYVEAEDKAKQAGLGIWKSRFLPPWEFRADMRAIEDRASARAQAMVRDALQQALTEGDGGIPIFRGFRVERGPLAQTRRELAEPEIGRSFITHSVSIEDAFSWREPAAALAKWRQVTVEKLRRQATGFLWDDLAARVRDTQEVIDADGYWRAVTRSAAPLAQAGKQPVLLVRATGDPTWIADWMTAPPAGASVTRKTDIASDLYLYTLGGVDIYLGPLSDGKSLLFPADLLATVTYGADPAGPVVTVEPKPGTEAEAGLAVYRFVQAFTWKSDPVSRIRYPRVPALEFPE